MKNVLYIDATNNCECTLISSIDDKSATLQLNIICDPTLNPKLEILGSRIVDLYKSELTVKFTDAEILGTGTLQFRILDDNHTGHYFNVAQCKIIDETLFIKQIDDFNYVLSIISGSGGGTVDAYTKAETNELLSGKSDTNHNHDNLYYTETETNELLSDKVATSQLTAHTSNKGNPHGVTKVQVGLGNVPNVTTNDQTPTFTVATTKVNIASGEKLNVILGKIAKFFTDLKAVAFSGSYADLTNKPSIPAAVAVKGNAESGYRTGNVNITPANIGLGMVNNTSDANKPISTAQQAAFDVRYTKTEVNNLISTAKNEVISLAEDYTDSEIAKLSGTTGYTKTETDDLIDEAKNEVLGLANTYTDTVANGKADSNHTHTNYVPINSVMTNGGRVSDDGNLYLNAHGYVGWLTNILAEMQSRLEFHKGDSITYEQIIGTSLSSAMAGGGFAVFVDLPKNIGSDVTSVSVSGTLSWVRHQVGHDNISGTTFSVDNFYNNVIQIGIKFSTASLTYYTAMLTNVTFKFN